MAAIGPACSSSPGPPPTRSLTSTVTVTCGLSSATLGRCAPSSQPRQISPRASARCWEGVRRSSSSCRASPSMTARRAVRSDSPVSGSRSPSIRTMPLKVTDACSRRPSRSVSVSRRSLSTRCRQWPSTRSSSPTGWTRAASTTLLGRTRRGGPAWPWRGGSPPRATRVPRPTLRSPAASRSGRERLGPRGPRHRATSRACSPAMRLRRDDRRARADRDVRSRRD